MRTFRHLTLMGVLAGASLAIAADADDIDRIVRSVGVDAIHTEFEAELRANVLKAIEQMARDGATGLPPTEGPEFEALVQQNLDNNRRLRRDPRVAQAYRATLSRMLNADELAVAAAFYSSPAGHRSHIAVVEAEKAAGAEMDKIAGEAPP